MKLEAAIQNARRVARSAGDNAPRALTLSDEELRESVERLITEKPRSLEDLCDILAPSRERKQYLRVRAALQWVKRNRKVANRGTTKKGVWHIAKKKRRSEPDQIEGDAMS